MHSDALAPSRPQERHTRTFNLLALSIAAAIGTAAPLPAVAQTSGAGAATAQTSEQRQYNIQGGPLDAVLNRFALEAGIDLSVSSELTRGEFSPGLTGQYSVNQALQRLLAGSGLTYRFTGTNTVTLAKAAAQEGDGPVQLGPMTVTARRVETPISSIPGAVTVIDRAQIEEQQKVTRDVGRILEHTVPGFIGSNPTRQQPTTIRGRSALVLINGVPQNQQLR